MENVIEIKNLSKAYDKSVLNNISLSIPTGTIVGLIGENGAGKSTLIKAILGIITSRYDELKIFNLDLQANKKEIKEDIAVIFHETYYNGEFTPKFIGKMLNHVYKNWDMNAYYAYLKKFQLPEKKKIKTFSRGMKVKLEFAIAFSHQAKLLILDEATSGLDPMIRDEILDMMRTFTEEENCTVFMSSHITSDLDKICDYIAYLRKGELSFIKSYEEVNELYGIIQVGKDIFESLDKTTVLSYIKNQYSYSVLIKNRQELQHVFYDLEIKRPTIEDMMLFYEKGVM